MTKMIPVQIVGLRVDPLTGASVVVLGELEQVTRVLPVIIGPVEAQSIADSLRQIEPVRPNAHDLAVMLLVAAGSRLDEIAVTELVDGVFFAEMFVESSFGMRSVSARPSDAIAIAVRVGAPMFVRESVLDAAAVPLEHVPSAALSDDEIDAVVREFQTFLDTARPSDFEADHDDHGDDEDDDDDAADADGEADADEDVGWGDDD